MTRELAAVARNAAALAVAITLVAVLAGGLALMSALFDVAAWLFWLPGRVLGFSTRAGLPRGKE